MHSVTSRDESPEDRLSRMMSWRKCIRPAFKAAIPVMLGYAAIGLPCGILCSSIGLDVLQVLLMSILFYSGAGQFMIPNMYLAGNPIVAIITTVSLVNTRQILYSASLAPRCEGASKPLAFFFAGTVTDESFGVSTAEFEKGSWGVRRGLLLNLFCQSSWTFFNMIGVLVGSLVDIPLPIATFAMTSIFICLLFTQPLSLQNICSAVLAVAGVFVCKLIGLQGASILLGALLGIAGGLVVDLISGRITPMNGSGLRKEADDGLE